MSFIFYGFMSYIFVFLFLFLIYFLYIYSSIEAITEAIYRWFHFSSTASVWLYKRVFTRLLHQPLIYAFSVPTTCLRIWCTNHLLVKYWLIRGEAHQYIDYIVCFNTEASHYHLNEHTILYIFRAPGYDSLVPLNWYKQGYFIIYIKEILVKDIIQIYIKEIFIRYKILNKIILDKNKKFIAVF